ncbi:MAG: hypothetical protein WCG52_10650 [bacterium]
MERQQNLSHEGKNIFVHRTELTKSDFDSFTLLVEVSNAIPTVNQLFTNPDLFRGTKLACLYDDVESLATLEILTGQEFTLSGDHQILHFSCSTIVGAQAYGELFEFLIPYGDFGNGDYMTRAEYGRGGFAQTPDHIKFTVDSVEWTLRHLFEIDGVFYPADQAITIQRAAGADTIRFDKSGHVALQVRTSNINKDSAEKTAMDVCWLLQLAFAQRVAWAELRVRNGSDSHFLCRRGFAFPRKSSGSKPIHNCGDYLIKNFIETAYPIYQSDSEWWAETINWYSISREDPTIEISSIIYSMLFERLSNHLLQGRGFPKQIGEDLANILKDKKSRKAFAESLGKHLQMYASKWSSFNSMALVQQIELWNNSPSYPKKTKAAFKVTGLKPPPPLVLQQRSNLMHDGGLRMERSEILEFYFAIHQQILLLLLSMVGYRSKFFCIGLGECEMSSFFADCPDDSEHSANPDQLICENQGLSKKLIEILNAVRQFLRM